jgi:hypothetical protein
MSSDVPVPVSPSEEGILEEYFITANRGQVQGCSFFLAKKHFAWDPVETRRLRFGQ